MHLMAKDIARFHAVIWPAMLMSAQLPLPKTIFAHGFFTINGEKMSKSLGNMVDPVELSKIYPLDAIRYFLLREIKFGEDGDFSLVHLKEHYNNDLANVFGNLLYRTLSMTEQYFGGRVPEHSEKSEGLDPLCEIDVWREFEDKMDNYKFNEALDVIWKVIDAANKFIENEKPWQLAKINENRLKDVLYNLLETLRQVGWLLLPLMPDTSERVWKQIGLDTADEKGKKIESAKIWGGLKHGIAVKKGEPIFPKII